MLSSHAGSSVAVETARRSAVLEIDVEGRWDALALSEILVPYHSYLVQHHGGRWVVHARAPGGRGEPLETALRAVADWARTRASGISSCRVDGRPYELGPKERR